LMMSVFIISWNRSPSRGGLSPNMWVSLEKEHRHGGGPPPWVMNNLKS